MSTATPSKPAFEMPPMSAEHTATQKVADRLVELCSQGKNLDAIRELYADNARHVEAMEGPGCPRLTEGRANILEKAAVFQKTTTIHSASCGKPIVNGDQFVLPMSMDCTCSEGPMANIRMQMSETCLYTVRNGKITEGKFFYSCGG
ncbi:MAG TPA: nuclear transport factor 2 family protein [Phycisphaerales bacterium]|nr:nuclear transport factor 2 family protein [Phycisphaerales bacterium]